MRWVALLCLAVLICGCGALPSPTPTGAPPATPTPAPTAVPTRVPMSTPTSLPPFTPAAPGLSGSAAIAQLAVTELAGRLNVKATDIQVKSVEPVDWPDASLGCPQPGMMYIQMITPGYKVTLSAGGKDYVVHTDGKQRAVYCLPK